jgi:hypothetical protein
MSRLVTTGLILHTFIDRDATRNWNFSLQPARDLQKVKQDSDFPFMTFSSSDVDEFAVVFATPTASDVTHERDGSCVYLYVFMLTHVCLVYFFESSTWSDVSAEFFPSKIMFLSASLFSDFNLCFINYLSLIVFSR